MSENRLPSLPMASQILIRIKTSSCVKPIHIHNQPSFRADIIFTTAVVFLLSSVYNKTQKDTIRRFPHPSSYATDLQNRRKSREEACHGFTKKTHTAQHYQCFYCTACKKPLEKSPSKSFADAALIHKSYLLPILSGHLCPVRQSRKRALEAILRDIRSPDELFLAPKGSLSSPLSCHSGAGRIVFYPVFRKPSACSSG